MGSRQPFEEAIWELVQLLEVLGSCLAQQSLRWLLDAEMHLAVQVGVLRQERVEPVQLKISKTPHDSLAASGCSFALPEPRSCWFPVEIFARLR